MAHIRKLPSGSYQIRKTLDGQNLSMVIDHKPTKSEADKLLFALAASQGVSSERRFTFEKAARSYIDSKSSIISQSTIRGYDSMLRNLPDRWKEKPVSQIRQKDVQRLLNQHAASHSPKSVRNLSGFISCVMRSVSSTWQNSVTLPQRQDPEFYVPEESDVRAILAAAKGSRYEIALWLAVYGLRRSEICALRSSDLDGTALTISKALVLGSDNRWTEKTCKTVSSVRTIYVSQYVADLIRQLPEDSPVYNGSPNLINVYLRSLQDSLGLPAFSLHKLRHFFASAARDIMSDAYVEEAGGWKPGSQVMKKVYAYAQKEKAAAHKAELAEKLGSLL